MTERSNNLFRDNRDFYPTPAEVIEQMMIGENYIGKTILEPSAGSGNIVDWFNEHGAAEVIACENDPNCKKLLAGKCRLIADDFLTVTAEHISHVDMIVMNPPFSEGAEHILHAWEIAPPGCVIIALCNSSNLSNSYYNDDRRLVEVVKLYGTDEYLGNVFTKAERTTDVNVSLVKLYKEGEGDDEFADYMFSQTDEDSLNVNESEGLVKHNVIREMVNRYMSAVKMFDEVMEATLRINEIAKATYDKYDYLPIRFCAVNSHGDKTEVTRIEYKKELQKYYWRVIFSMMDMERFNTQNLRTQMNRFIEKQQHVPFTMGNIYHVLNIIVQTHGQRMHKALMEAFDHICQFSYENCTGGRGWKTNANYMVNRKFIVPYICSATKYGYKNEYVMVSENYANIMTDVAKALCYLTGRDFNEIGGLSGICSQFAGNHRQKWGEWFFWGFFRCKGYKKGTMHFEFLDEDVWLRFNMAVASTRGWTLPEKGEWQQAPSKLIPRIKKGYNYICKKTIINDGKESYVKGKVYRCELEHNCYVGYITNEQGLNNPWRIYIDKSKFVDDWRDWFEEIM